MATRFLFNSSLWEELSARVPKAKKVQAAVAYFGSGGATLLPLKKGDELVVDMSLGRVRAGATDPKEIKTLLGRGVKVFTRTALHAKFFVFDRAVIAGSSNISNYSRDTLEEAALITDDPAAVRRAIETFDQLCTEPVRKDYLAKCLQEYRPPSFGGGGKVATQTRSKARVGKLWFLGGLQYRNLPAAEEKLAQEAVSRAKRKLLDFERSEVEFTHYPEKQKFMKQLRDGDWIVPCIKNGTGFDVWPPSHLLGVEHHSRGNGKHRYLVLYEQPQSAAAVRWTTLRRRSAVTLPPKPKTNPVVSDVDADAILRLWDYRGRFKK